MQKIDACGMLAQWPVSWGAAPKAEGPLSTDCVEKAGIGRGQARSLKQS
jgi:hypothetical protein